MEGNRIEDPPAWAFRGVTGQSAAFRQTSNFQRAPFLEANRNALLSKKCYCG